MPRTRKRPRKRKHDASYNKIFAHRRTVADLLRGFAGKLARHLDLSTLERLPASFVTEHLGQRHADMLWKIQTADGSWLYLLVLLEFQSTIDHDMALRMLDYTVRVLQGLGRDDRGPGGKYPPLLPVELQTTSEEEEVSTLAERVRKWGDELNQQWLEKGIERGREKGIEQGERLLVYRLAAHRFGSGIAEQLGPLLDELSDPERIAAVATMVLECESGEEFIARAREV